MKRTALMFGAGALALALSCSRNFVTLFLCPVQTPSSKNFSHRKTAGPLNLKIFITKLLYF